MNASRNLCRLSTLLVLGAGCSTVIDTTATFDHQADGNGRGGAGASSVLGNAGSGGRGAADGSTAGGGGEAGSAEGGEVGAAGQASQAGEAGSTPPANGGSAGENSGPGPGGSATGGTNTQTEGGAAGEPGVPECEKSARFCSGRSVRECDESGFFSEEVDTCASNQYCDVPSATCKTGVCSPNTPSCDGARATTCDSTGSGYAAGGTVCGAGTACDAGACRDQICEPDANFCQGQQVKNCASNGLVSTVTTTCSQNEYCDEDAAQCVEDTCISGTRQCGAGQQPELCNTEGSAWVNDGGACSGGTPVCFEGGCVQCSPESKGCAGVVPRLCSEEGSWIAQPACEDPEPICVPATATCTHADPMETAGLIACGEDAESFCDVSGNGALASGAQVVCCLVYRGAEAMDRLPAYDCLTRNQCPMGSYAGTGYHACDADNDCPSGQVCCLNRTASAGEYTTCQAECEPPGQNGTVRAVCDPNAGSCPIGTCALVPADTAVMGFFAASGLGRCP